MNKTKISAEVVADSVDAKIDADGFINIEGHTNLNVFGWCNNLKGFIPYRYMIDNKKNIIINGK